MQNELYATNRKTARCSTEIISLFSLKIWALIPQNPSSLPYFKNSIRRRKPNCPRCLCKTYMLKLAKN